MPRKGNSQRKEDGHVGVGKQKRVPFMGYINYSPTEADKQGLRKLVETGHDVALSLPDILLSGYKLSVSWDSYHQAYSASLYDTNVDSPTGGYNLAARAGNPDAALVRLIYLHVYVFEGDWSAALDQQKSEDAWGA